MACDIEFRKKQVMQQLAKTGLTKSEQKDMLNKLFNSNEDTGPVAPSLESSLNKTDKQLSDRTIDNDLYINKSLLEKIKNSLISKFPEIPIESLDTTLSSYSHEDIFNATSSAIDYSQEKDSINTLPKKYAHIYIDLLEKTKYIDRVLTSISKKYNLSRQKAKEYLATQMGGNYVEYIKNDIKPVELSRISKIWKIIKNAFSNNELKQMIGYISHNFYIGKNADAIRFSPKKGYSKVDTESTFKDQPFASKVLKTVMSSAKGNALFTGSAALALQGDVYRKGKKGITDLHDLDFAVNYSHMGKIHGDLWREFSVDSLYDFNTSVVIQGESKERSVKSYIVVDKKYNIINKKYHGSKIKSYEIAKKGNNFDIVGTYNTTFKKGKLQAEHKKGVEAVFVDLLEEDLLSKKSINYYSKELGMSINISAADDIFDAKNNMGILPRDKDIMDFNSFYTSSNNKSYGRLKDEYKGKIILSNSGSGKSFASSITDNIVDSDKLLANILNTTQSGIVKELHKLSKEEVNDIYKKLAIKSKELAKNGKTILSPSTHEEMVKIADMSIVNTDKYSVQKNSNAGGRDNPLSRSIAQAKGSIDLFVNNIKDLNTIKLKPNEYISDKLFNSNKDVSPVAPRSQEQTYNKDDITDYTLVNRVIKKGNKSVRETMRVESRKLNSNGKIDVTYYTDGGRSGKVKKRTVEVNNDGAVPNSTTRWSVAGLKKVPDLKDYYIDEDGIDRNRSNEVLKESIWNNPEKAKDLLDYVINVDGDIDKDYANDMSELLDSITDENSKILNKFKLYINDKASKNQGLAQIGKAGSSVLLNINTDGYIAGEETSATEAYMHEMIHMAKDFADRFRKGEIYSTTRDINELYKKVSKKTKWEDLVEIDTKAGRAKAKRIYDHMFKNEDTGVNEFVAIGLTNKTMINHLKNLDLKIKEEDKLNGSIFNKLANLIVKMYTAIRNLGVDKDSDAHDMLMEYAGKLMEHNNITIDHSHVIDMAKNAGAKVLEQTDKVILSVVENGANMLGKGMDKTIDIIGRDNIVGQGLNVTRNLGKIFNPLQSEMSINARNKTLTELSTIMDGDKGQFGLGGLLAPEGTVMQMANYLSADDSETQRVEKFALINENLDRIRNTTIGAVAKSIKGKFNKISPSEQLDVTNGLIRTDMQSIYGEYSLDEINKFMKSDSEVDNAIENERKKVDSLTGNKYLRNYIKSQAIGLGIKIATGISGSSVQNNSKNILYLKGVLQEAKRDINLPPRKNHQRLIDTIDRLATLESIKHVDEGTRESVSNMIKHNREGIDFAIKSHKVYVGLQKEYNRDIPGLNDDNKGEIKDTSLPGMTSKVGFDDEATAKIMKDKGYKKADKAGVEGLAVYVSNTDGTAQFEKQATAKINQMKRLHNMVGVVNASGKKMTESDFKEIETKIKLESLVDIGNQIDGIVTPNMNGYIQIYGKDGTTYGVSVANSVEKKVTRQDNKAPLLLGKMIAEIQEKKSAKALNSQVYAEILNNMKMYKRGSDSNKYDYIEIGPDANTANLREELYSKELWKNIPSDIRANITSRNKGAKFISIRRDLAPMYFGEKVPTLKDMKVPFTKGKTVVQFAKKIPYGDTLVRIATLLEDMIAYIVSIQKIDIVIKTPKVLKDNVISNTNFLVVLGQGPVDAINGQIKMFTATKRYMDDSKRLVEMEHEYSTSGSKELKQEILTIKATLKNNPIKPLVDAGLFTSIIEEISDDDLVSNRGKERFMPDENSAFGKFISKIPTVVKEGGKTLYMTEETGLFRLMLIATQYSDFVARATRYNYLVETKGMSSEQAIKMVLDDFVNYNRISGRGLRRLGRVGVIWFYKYILGASKSELARLKDRPTAILGMEMLLDAPNPSEGNILETNYASHVNGPIDIVWDGTKEHIIPASAVEILEGKGL